MVVKNNDGFDLLTFYLVVSLLLMALIVVLLIKMNLALRKMDYMEGEIAETHRKTDQVRHNLVWTAEELKRAIETEAVVKEIIEEKARKKAEELLELEKNAIKEEEGR